MQSTEEDKEAWFEGKKVSVVGKRRSYIQIKEENGKKKWVDGKMVSGIDVLPLAVLKSRIAEVTGGDALPSDKIEKAEKQAEVEITEEEEEEKEDSDSESVLSDKEVIQKRDTLTMPKRRSVTFSPVVQTRDLDTFESVTPTILGARSERSNSGLGRGWYTLNTLSSVRETAESTSEHLYTLSPGAVVHVSKVVEGDAQIDSPCGGWITVSGEFSPLSDEEIKKRGLANSVPASPLLMPNMPGKGMSNISLASGVSEHDLDPGMNDWLASQLQKVEDEIYGTKKESILKNNRVILPSPDIDAETATDSTVTKNENPSLDADVYGHSLTLSAVPSLPSTIIKNSHNSVSPNSPLINALPPVPDKLGEIRPFSGMSAGPIDSLLLQRESLGTINEIDLKKAEHRPTLSTFTNPSSSDKVLDPEPQIMQAHAADANSLVFLLQQLSSTRKEITRLQKLEKTLVSQVIGCFDSVMETDEEYSNAEYEAIALIQQRLDERKQAGVKKRLPTQADLVSEIPSDYTRQKPDSPPTKAPLVKRSSENNLFRHGSMHKWDPEELERHEQLMKEQVAALSPRKEEPPLSKREQNRKDKDELMRQGKNLIMKMAEFMGDMSDASPARVPKSIPALEKRSSDYNLFRHGSISKWSDEELERHKANLKSQVDSLKHEDVKPELEKRTSETNLFRHGSMLKWSPEELEKHEMNLKKSLKDLVTPLNFLDLHKRDKKSPKTKIETMISIRNSDINLFRPQSSNKWDDSEIKRAVDNMQNEMEKLHEKMMTAPPVGPEMSQVYFGPKTRSVVIDAPTKLEEKTHQTQEMEDRALTRARCLSYDSSLLFSDSSDVEDLVNAEQHNLKKEEENLKKEEENRKIEQKTLQEIAIERLEQDEDSAGITSSECFPPPTP